MRQDCRTPFQKHAAAVRTRGRRLGNATIADHAIRHHARRRVDASSPFATGDVDEPLFQGHAAEHSLRICKPKQPVSFAVYRFGAGVGNNDLRGILVAPDDPNRIRDRDMARDRIPPRRDMDGAGPPRGGGDRIKRGHRGGDSLLRRRFEVSVVVVAARRGNVLDGHVCASHDELCGERNRCRDGRNDRRGGQNVDAGGITSPVTELITGIRRSRQREWFAIPGPSPLRDRTVRAGRHSHHVGLRPMPDKPSGVRSVRVHE